MFAAALAVKAARVHVDIEETLQTGLAEASSPPQFPGVVVIRNGETHWLEAYSANMPSLLWARAWDLRGRTEMDRILMRTGEPSSHWQTGALLTYGVEIGHSWAIRQHEGTSAFTMCNPWSCSCLFATEERTVGVSDRGFEDDQLWMIEPTDDGTYTITHQKTNLRFYSGGMTGDELGIGDDAFGHRDRIWPDQTWYIEDKLEYCGAGDRHRPVAFEGDALPAGCISSSWHVTPGGQGLCPDLSDFQNADHPYLWRIDGRRRRRDSA